MKSSAEAMQKLVNQIDLIREQSSITMSDVVSCDLALSPGTKEKSCRSRMMCVDGSEKNIDIGCTQVMPQKLNRRPWISSLFVS